MTVKDFTKGQTAYIFDNERNKSLIIETTIVSVGRKLVKTSCRRTYEETPGCKGLMQRPDDGHRTQLFPTKEQAEEEKEYQELLTWYHKNTNLASRLSLHQLRAIKQIWEQRDVRPQFTGAYGSDANPINLGNTVDLFGQTGTVVFEEGVYGIAFNEVIDWNTIESAIPDVTSTNNQPAFCHNDHFISL